MLGPRLQRTPVSTTGNLYRHQRENSGEAAKLPCDRCDKTFTRPAALKVHTNKFHSRWPRFETARDGEYIHRIEITVGNAGGNTTRPLTRPTKSCVCSRARAITSTPEGYKFISGDLVFDIVLTVGRSCGDESRHCRVGLANLVLGTGYGFGCLKMNTYNIDTPPRNFKPVLLHPTTAQIPTDALDRDNILQATIICHFPL